MDSELEAILEGSLGYFWPIENGKLDRSTEPQRGYLRQDQESRIRLDTLVDDRMSQLDRFSGKDGSPPVSAMAGITEHGTVVLHEIYHNGSRFRIGSSTASVHHYRSNSLIAKISLDHIEELDSRSMSAYFPGVLHWAGLKSARPRPKIDSEGKVTGITVELESAEDQVVSLSDSLDLCITNHWSGMADSEKQVFDTALSVSCTSSAPSVIESLIEPLFAIQGLISLAFGRLVTANGGGISIATVDGGKTDGSFLNSMLTSKPGSSDSIDSNNIPFFYLADFGGLESLSKWVTLTAEHPRAVRPLVQQFRRGSLSVELRLIEIAAAIEYWVAAHRRTEPWTKGYPFAEALARHVGVGFNAWVGDQEKWATKFWDFYNGLKHRPAQLFDPREVYLLAKSGETLLTCALVNSVSATGSPGSRLLAHPRTQELGTAVREIVS